MSTPKWTTVPATDVRIGDRIRTSGLELTVTRIDVNFFGTDMLAFVEDTDSQWIKAPSTPTSDIEVARTEHGAA